MRMTIMVRIRIGSTEYKCVARGSAPDGEFPSDPALLAVHPPSACSGVKALRNTSSAKAASRLASLPFRSLDPFRALREPDRRLPDEERPSPRRTKNRHYRSQRAASDRPAVRLWWQLSGRNRLTRKAPYKSFGASRPLPLGLAHVPSANPLPPLSLGGANRSTCSQAAIAWRRWRGLRRWKPDLRSRRRPLFDC